MSIDTRDSRKLWKRLGAFAIAVLLLCAVWWWQSPPPGGARAEATARAEQDAAGAQLSDDHAKGQSRAAAMLKRLGGRYRLDYQMSLQAPSSLGPADAKVDLQAALEVAAGQDARWLVGRLVDVELKADPRLLVVMGIDEGGDAKTASASFSHPFALLVDGDGAIVELRHDARASVGSRHLVAGLLYGLQLVQPELEVGKAAWTVREPDTDGKVEARYALRAGGLDKSWFSKGIGTELAQEDKSHVSSQGRCESDLRDGRIQRATYQLEVRADLGLGVGEARYDGDVKAKLEREADIAGDWARGIDLAALESGLGARRLQAPQPILNVRDGATVGSLIAAASAASAKQDSKARRAAKQELALMIQRQPALAREVAQILREDRVDVERRSLIEALASSDTAEAKAEMAAMIDDATLNTSLRADVATGTTFMPRPGEGLLNSLRGQSEQAGLSRLGTASLYALSGQARMQPDVALAAQLSAELQTRALIALGEAGAALEAQTLANKRKEEATKGKLPLQAPVALAGEDVAEESAVVVTAPVVGLQPGKGGALPAAPAKTVSPGQAIAWLDAVGTLGGDAVRLLIAPWHHHPEHQVRMTAAFALRFVHTLEGRQKLVDILNHDPDGWVRRSAVMAMRFHPMAPFIEPVKRALKEDVHANVRLAAAYNLSVWSTEAPALIEAVRAAAKREPKEFVQRAMEDLEPMLFRDPPGGGPSTMEPMLHGGKHTPSVPEGVVLVERQVGPSAATAEGELTSAQVEGSAPAGAAAAAAAAKAGMDQQGGKP